MIDQTLDVVYVSFNRVEFTQRTFPIMVENTNWEHVRQLVVYDDGSEPWTRLWIQDACASFTERPISFRTRDHRWGSPVAIMADYLENDPADFFAKLDNDIAVCPGWLDALLSVREVKPYIDLLGMEAGMTRVRGRDGNDPDEPWTFEPSTHIGGIGLMRTAAFDKRPLDPLGRYFGFTEWQHKHQRVTRGWITPDLPVPLLDRLPLEPFVTLSRRYVDLGWQRRWGSYSFDGWMDWAYNWVLEREAECSTA